jgi:hypothetical protein
VKYAFAQAHREEFELKRMCRVLQVSAAGITTGPDVKSPSAANKTVCCSRRFAGFTRKPKEAYGATKT